MKLEEAIQIIENVSGFDDETTSVGEAWDTIKNNIKTIQNDPVYILKTNGIDCSEVILGTTIHIFSPNVTEDILRKLIGNKMINYKHGTYGSINSIHNKSIFHEINVMMEKD